MLVSGVTGRPNETKVPLVCSLTLSLSRLGCQVWRDGSPIPWRSPSFRCSSSPTRYIGIGHGRNGATENVYLLFVDVTCGSVATLNT